MLFFTITESRDDQRVAQFATFAKNAGATGLLVISRPAHVSPDLARWTELGTQIETLTQQATEAGTSLLLDRARALLLDRDAAAAERTALERDASKWLADALALAEMPSTAGFVVLGYGQWPESEPWSVSTFVPQIMNLQSNGINGRPLSVPLTSRVFVPLSAFDVMAKTVKAAPVKATSADSAILNRPSTAPTQVNLKEYSDAQQNVLNHLVNPQHQRCVVTYLGWDQNRPRNPRESGIAMGLTVPAFTKMLTAVEDLLTAQDIDLDALHKIEKARHTGQPVEDPLLA